MSGRDKNRKGELIFFVLLPPQFYCFSHGVKKEFFPIDIDTAVSVPVSGHVFPYFPLAYWTFK
jgi:hypothetical protein